MFERKIIINQLIIFIATLLTVSVLIELTENGTLPKSFVPGVIIAPAFIGVVTGWIMYNRVMRNTKVGEHIQDQLSKFGYELISERPLNAGEDPEGISFKPTILLGGMPIQNFSQIAQYKRILTVRTADGDKLDLCAQITKTWKKNFELKIFSKD